MAQFRGQPQEILLPARGGFVAMSFAVAFLLNLLPMQGLARDLYPDFVAMLVLYWSLHAPRTAGIGVAWLMGLLSDVADAVVLGQHALAYASLAFLGIVMHRRTPMFSSGQQLLQVFVMLQVPLLVSAIVRLAGGAGFPGWTYFLSAVTAASLWPPLSHLLQIPQRKRPEADAV